MVTVEARTLKEVTGITVQVNTITTTAWAHINIPRMALAYLKETEIYFLGLLLLLVAVISYPKNLNTLILDIAL